MEEKKTNSKSHPVICPKCKYNRPVALSYCPHCREEAKRLATNEQPKDEYLSNKFISKHVFKASTKGEGTQQKEQQTANGQKANKQQTVPGARKGATSRTKKPGKPVRTKR